MKISNIAISNVPLMGCNSFHLKEGYLLYVQLNDSETQVFILDNNYNLIQTNPIWSIHHLGICRHFLPQSIFLRPAESFVVFPGTFHFGHVIGDLCFLLMYSSLCMRNGSSAGVLLPHKPDLSTLYNLFHHLPNSIIYLPSLSSNQAALVPLRDCLVLLPDTDPTLSIQTAKNCVSRILNQKSSISRTSKVFLHSGRTSRIENLSDVSAHLSLHGYLSVQYQNYTLVDLLSLLSSASSVISENGSILMNMFLTFDRPYFVLSSPRVSTNSPIFYDGGYKYNSFHHGLISYLHGSLVSIGKHPYSDKVKYDLPSFNSILD
jgi:hypothetical protein